MKNILTTLIAAFLICTHTYAQQVEEAAIPDDSYYEQESRQRFPVLGQFKEPYFITGIPTTSSVNKHNADVRFQVSLALRVARIDNVDILGTYTETGVWNVYDTSSPLVENAFNPGFCIYWYVNPKLDMMFGGDHMSNGYVNERSRSVNTAYVGAVYSPYRNLSLGGKAWYGYYEHIPGLTHFKNYNLEFNLSYRLSNKGTFLPAVFAQYRQGYCETLLNFNKYESHVRVGFALELKHGYNSSIH